MGVRRYIDPEKECPPPITEGMLPLLVEEAVKVHGLPGKKVLIAMKVLPSSGLIQCIVLYDPTINSTFGDVVLKSLSDLRIFEGRFSMENT